MELKDIKSLSRRAKRLRTVYFAIGVLISFLSDLSATKFKTPFSNVFYSSLVKMLEEVRQKVVLEQDFIKRFTDKTFI